MTFAKRRLGRTVIELEDVSLSTAASTAGEPAEQPGDASQRLLLDHVTWRIGPGERIGLVGVNGSGKTSLLRLLAGERQQLDGERIQGQTVNLAHLTQELHDLPPTLRVLEAIEEVANRVVVGSGDRRPRSSPSGLALPQTSSGRRWGIYPGVSDAGSNWRGC